MMKYGLLIVVMSLSVSVAAQEKSFHTITLRGWHGKAGQLPSLSDTVYLLKDEMYTPRELKTLKTYTDVEIQDSAFSLAGVPTGRYWLQFSAKEFCISPLLIVVCSRCDNEFTFIASIQEPQTNCDVFEMVEIEPGYAGGDKALSRDFQKSLTKKEKQQLKAAEDFSVRIFLTKQGSISDLSFTPSTLSEEIKTIIQKGFSALNKWRPAERNGKIADDELILSKHSLMSD